MSLLFNDYNETGDSDWLTAHATRSLSSLLLDVLRVYSLECAVWHRNVHQAPLSSRWTSRPPSEVGQRPGLGRAWRLIVQEELHNELDTFRQSAAAVQDGSLAVDGRAAACRPQRHGLVDLRSLAGQVERCATNKRVCQVEHDGELGHVAVEVEASRASAVKVRRKVLPGDIPRDEETRANAAVLAAVCKLLRHLTTQATVLLCLY